MSKLYRVVEKGDVRTHRAIVDMGEDCPIEQISDGFHTFGELYEHRYVLFCAFARLAFDLAFRGRREALYCWKSSNHWIDGKLESVWPGWFIAGIDLHGKQITYHLPLTYWESFEGVDRDTPPEYDGHTSADVVERLKEWIKS